MADHFVLPLPPSLEVPLTGPTTHYEQMISSPDAAAASQHETMTNNSTTTNYVQPTPIEGLVPSPLTFETTRQAPQGTNATCYTTATTTTTTPMVGVDRIPSKLASRSFGSARSNRSRRSTRSRDSARSHNNNNRIVYSTTAHYDTWMIFLLSLPILFIFLWMVVLVSTYDHWERSPTEWILSWSLLLLVGSYMVVLPRQLNIRSNGSLGIKTFLCTFHFSNVCHVSRATTHNTTTTTTGTPIEHYYNNDNKNNCAAVSSWEPPRQGVWWGPLLRVHRLGTSLTSIPCVLRRRRRAATAVEQGQEFDHSDHNGGLLWDVHVTPHNPTEFVQHFESVLTRLEIQRANANVAPPHDGTADSAMNGVFATTATAGSVGGMGDSLVSYHHHNRVPQEDHPPLAVVTATFV